MTPRARSASPTRPRKLVAPRILKAPPTCRLSHLSATLWPQRSLRASEGWSGVTRARFDTRRRASRKSPGPSPSSWLPMPPYLPRCGVRRQWRAGGRPPALIMMGIRDEEPSGGGPGMFAKEGLEGVVAARTGLSRIDGEKGELSYRGYSIHDLARHSDFEECVHLLWYGELPTRAQLAETRREMAAQRALHTDALEILRRFARDASPMDMLRTVVSALA